MIKTSYQTPELRDANDNIIQSGAFGKNTALSNSTNDGWIDYVMNNLEALHDVVGETSPTLDGNGHVVEPANLAIGDEDGNRIKNSYLKLSGGKVTGVASFRTSLRMLDNQDNRWGGLYVPGTTSSVQYLSLYSGTRAPGDAYLNLFALGNGKFEVVGYSSDGANIYVLTHDNDGRLKWRGSELAFKSNVLPLSGGTMTGNVRFNQAWSAIVCNYTNNEGAFTIHGGDGNDAGAIVRVYGKNAANPGHFVMQAHDGTNSKVLRGKPDGTLTWDDNAIALAKNVLPLTGGTLSGAVTTTVSDFIKKNNDTAHLRLMGGTGLANGASLTLIGIGHSTQPGQFMLRARNASSYKDLLGKPDGTLTWGNNAVWTGNVTAEQTPTLDATNVLSNSVLTYQKVGKLVYVNVQTLRMSENATTTYNGMAVATGFPTPAFTQRFCPLGVSDESAQPVPSINVNGTMYVATRGTSIANKVLFGGFVYIAQ